MRPLVPDHLRGLVRRELIQPDSSSLTIDDAFLPRPPAHPLGRRLRPRAGRGRRVELHEAFATWLERTADQRVGEYQAILGHHLEQACRLRHELGLVADELDIERARRGAMWLARAADRSLDQGDDRAGAGLLRRAAALLPTGGPERAERLVELGCALRRAGELADAARPSCPRPWTSRPTRSIAACTAAPLLERMTVRLSTWAQSWALRTTSPRRGRPCSPRAAMIGASRLGTVGSRMGSAGRRPGAGCVSLLGTGTAPRWGVVGTHGWRSTAWEACESLLATSAPLQRRSPSA